MIGSLFSKMKDEWDGFTLVRNMKKLRAAGVNKRTNERKHVMDKGIECVCVRA